MSRTAVRMALSAVALATLVASWAAPMSSSAQTGQRRSVQLHATVNLAALAAGPRSPVATHPHRSVLPEVDKRYGPAAHLATAVPGGAGAPPSQVVSGGGNADGFRGLDIVSMEAAGTGSYQGSNGGLEPPDQMLCVGSGFVVEGVNTAIEVFSDRGVPLVGAVPLTQFMNLTQAKNAVPGTFTSDPRCIYDAATKRFFLMVLEIDSSNGVLNYPFTRSHTYFAVSKTSDPTGAWSIYGYDVTDDGIGGTPVHPTCPCLDDQPLMGTDPFGFYITANEYSDAEVLPVASPVNPPFGTLPDFRNGQSQVYAFPKAALEAGASQLQFTDFDSANTPLPANAPQGSTWSELQPAHSPPGDATVQPQGGAEFFMSQLDFDGQGDNRVAVWAITNTASLATATPSVTLTSPTLVTTLNPADTYKLPSSGVDQKEGDHPLCASCSEERINPNDDRMNEVMLTNGQLWGAVNTDLPPITAGAASPEGDDRTGIMYFEVSPALDSSSHLTATMTRDGYVTVPRESVLFPSIGATPGGAVIMTFSLSGVDYFPSVAWTRLDGLAPGTGPVVHVDAAGTAPEDGFTGYGTCASFGLASECPPQGSGVSRWGDYSFSEVDEKGCVWGAGEYIPGGSSDGVAGDWGTWIHRIAPAGCTEPALTPVAKLTTNPCGPLFTSPAGSDDYLGVATGHAFKGQNPQLDLLSGTLGLTSDGTQLVATLVLNNLTTALPPGGQANEYYLLWTFNNTQWFANAQVDTAGTVTYSDGQVNGTQFVTRTTGPTDTGAFNSGSNGSVVMHVPRDQVGDPGLGIQLTSPKGSTKELVGVAGVGGSLQPVDDAGPDFQYTVGQTCAKLSSSPSPSPAASTTNSAPSASATIPVPVVPETLPNSGTATPTGPALGIGGVVALLCAGWLRRRRPGCPPR
ncbi:MAG TPA: hypothetical protein VN193_02695 [Candidatus Angelobacter sp.]|jgi:hypothetical protein|nr:hypothetical protein [Candidatus Angelobacter sp.]